MTEPAGPPGRVSLVASAPGKLILMGEHAVVYGHPALVGAVDLRLRVRFSAMPPARPARVELRLPGVGHRETSDWPALLAYARDARARWERYASAPSGESFARLRGGDRAHVVKVALGEAAAGLGESFGPALRLDLESELEVGSGLGSSAATAVAVAGGYLAWRGIRPTTARLEPVVLEVERRQHGSPSGVDGATVLRGGLVWAEREGGTLRFRAFRAPPERLRGFAVFDTGAPDQPTGAVVAAVRERLEADRSRLGAVLEDMGETTRRFRDALLAAEGKGEPLVPLIRRYEAGLEALGVVPPAALALVRRVEAEGGAAKISGAGALASGTAGRPGAGSMLVYHPSPGRVDAWSFLEGVERRDLSLGGEGFRVEEAVTEEPGSGREDGALAPRARP